MLMAFRSVYQRPATMAELFSCSAHASHDWEDVSEDVELAKQFDRPASEPLPAYVPSNEKRTIQRESMDALRADLGLGEISDMEYRQFTTFCRQRYGDRWAVGMNCREAESVDLLYHQFTASLAAGENDFGDVVVDLSKSLERGAYKTDGRMPTLTTSSHIFSFSEQRLMRPPELFASHGFNLTEVKFIPNKRSLYSSMTGNAMSVPVVGACILSVILVAGLRESHQYPKLHTRQVKAGSDTSPEGSTESEDMDVDNDA